MKYLFVMRHAKSDWSDGAAPDIERRLTGRGERDASRVGRFLAAQKLRPDKVYSSPAARAAQTAALVARELRQSSPVERLDRLYGSSGREILQLLAGLDPEVERPLVVGHNPLLEDLLRLLLGLRAGVPGVRLPTGAAAHLELTVESWSDLKPGRGQLLWLVVPRSLRRLC